MACVITRALFERHGRAQRVVAPEDPAIHGLPGLVKETWMPGRADAIRAPGHDDWNRLT